MMTIRLHRHIFSGLPPEQFEAQNIARWLVEHYGTSPTVSVQVFAGEPSGETDVTGNVEALLRSDAPVYVVLESPGLPALPYIYSILISMAISAAVSFLFAKDPKSIDNRNQESPNNQLSDRQNRVRALERVEDIYGTVKAIPSLLMPTYNKYIEHKKVEYGYYCVGRGYYDIDQIRDGDTLLTGITGASAAVYEPFTSPNSGAPILQIGDPIIDAVLTVTRSSSVDGITLKAQNQINLSAGQDYFFYGPGPGSGLIPATALDLLLQPTNARRPNFAAVAEAGQALDIVMADSSVIRVPAGVIDVDAASNTYISSTPGIFRGVVDGTAASVAGGFGTVANTGAKTVVSHTDTTLTVAEALVDEAAVGGSLFTVLVNYSGTRTIAAVESGYITLNGPAQFVPDVAETLNADLTVDNGVTDWTDWYTLPDTDRTEVWTNVLAPAGMYKDDGAKSGTTVAYEVQIEQLSALLAPLGVVETVSGSITGSTSSERAETLERVTAWVGPARVRVRRTTPFDYDFGGLVNDEIKWVDLYGVSPVTRSHFGNKTTIHTITKATAGSTSIRSRELNCLASRLLPTYNGTTFSGTIDVDGVHSGGTLNATSKIVDIIAAVALDRAIGARTLADLDMAQLWATQQALDAWHPEAGQFNYTFDTDNLSFEETVNAIANAAFCVAYRQNGKIRLALDRPQANSVALFTHRNKKPNAETITRMFASDADYDGVELVYMDPDTEQQETIRIPLDGSYTKLKKVEITGIRSYEQAWFRANREYRRLIAQRLTIDTETTTDARALLPNSRVDIVDNTRFKSWDGEVVAQSGLTLTLSRDVQFTPATPHSILLMKRDGSLQSIACTEVAGAPNKVLLAGAPAEAIVTQMTPEDGIRTIFSFATDSARPAQAWLVQEIGPTDGGYVRIKAVNYSDDYYAADSEPVPDKSGVIN